MDNIIEYLVAIIFIVSFLSELFGKKKKKNEDKSSTTFEDDKPVIISTEKKYDPFEFNLPDFNDLETKSKKQKKFNKNYQNYEDSFKKDEELIKKKKSLIDEYEKSYVSESSIKQVVKSQKANYSSDELKNFSANINNTKNSLFNPVSIRDYIIASEILGKPISLKNRCRKI
ncbi:MAG TPA: hypothetical protein PL041_10055 [Melioribacteraceae bacterium]|nr:hypothetical protein [Melioribacteraceae bacterium]